MVNLIRLLFLQIAMDPHQEKTFLQFKEIIINLAKDKDSVSEFINMFHCWNPQMARWQGPRTCAVFLYIEVTLMYFGYNISPQDEYYDH